jgi:hypothetical protein
MKLNRTTFRHLVVAGAAALAAGSAVSARAAVVMDQIGSSPSFFTGQDANLSQNFGGGFASDDTAVVDDFSVNGPTTLTNVSAALLGFNGFTSYSLVTGYEVAIYSSPSAATSSLTGNVYDHTFTPASVSLTAPYSGDTESGLVSIPTNISIPAAGTYEIAVIVDNTFSANGEIGVYDTTGLPGSTPGGDNAFQANPGGGFAFSSNSLALGADAAYSITAAPVPEPTALFMLGIAGLSLSRRRHKML